VLPVSVSAHIGNKAISAMIWIFITILVAILTGLLIGIGALIVSGEAINLQDLFRALHELRLHLPEHFGLYFFEVLILAVTGIVKTIMQIYAAVTIGHQAPNRTTLASIGAYILILVFESSVGRMLMPLMMAVDSMDSFAGINRVFVPALLTTIGFSAIYFFVCKYLMEKRLNLA
jgi:hypothetical protein